MEGGSLGSWYNVRRGDERIPARVNQFYGPKDGVGFAGTQGRMVVFEMWALGTVHS